jgi:dihydroxyacid dehydratase/phosphogluconate dehydratase
MQQWALLRQEGLLHPDLIKIFYKDLEDILTGWHKEQHEIILMMDANEPIGKAPGGLTIVMGKVGMSDLLRYKHQNHGESHHICTRFPTN